MNGNVWLCAALVAAQAIACSDGEDALAVPTSIDAGRAARGADAPDAAEGGAGNPAVDAGPVDPFALPVTYEQPKPTRSASIFHQSKGVNPNNPTRQSCLGAQCHVGNSAPFAFALTVCTDERCRAYEKDVEVRVVGSDGVVFSSYTGEDGNAWFYDNGKLKFPAYAGIRTPQTTKVMQGQLVGGTNAGSCNMQGCHGANPNNTPADAALNVVLYVQPKAP
jgi:hypothetical protein